MSYDRTAIMNAAWAIFRQRNGHRPPEVIKANRHMLFSIALTLAWEDAKPANRSVREVRIADLRGKLECARRVDRYSEMRREVAQIEAELQRLAA